MWTKLSECIRKYYRYMVIQFGNYNTESTIHIIELIHISILTTRIPAERKFNHVQKEHKFMS